MVCDVKSRTIIWGLAVEVGGDTLRLFSFANKMSDLGLL